MSAKQWTEKQTKEVMKKVIRRAEVSRIARLLQHRLALANVKTQNGWENLTLDAIEPKVEEGLRRKRERTSQEKSPAPLQSFSSSTDSVQTSRSKRDGLASRPVSQCSDVGPLLNLRASKKRARDNSSPEYALASAKRPRMARDPRRMVQSSPGFPQETDNRYSYGYHTERTQDTSFHSSPPRTPPRRMFKNKNTGEEGADLLLYLATSPSPAAAMTKNPPPTTPPSHPSALPSSMMHTPGGPQTPQTGFNFADFVNITPSPAPGALRSVGRGTPVPQGRGTPIAQARRRLNFDSMGPPTSSPHISAPPGITITRSGAHTADVRSPAGA